MISYGLDDVASTGAGAGDGAAFAVAGLAGTGAVAPAAGEGTSVRVVLSCTIVGVPGLPEWHKLQFSIDHATLPL
jgi:hypothetical protein